MSLNCFFRFNFIAELLRSGGGGGFAFLVTALDGVFDLVLGLVLGAGLGTEIRE